MKRKYFLTGLIVLLVSCTDSLTYKSVKTSEECKEKKGYWYKEQCWKEFEDEGISKADIDRVVDEQIKIIEKSKFTFDNKAYPLILFEASKEDDAILIIAIFRMGDNDKTLLFALEGVDENSGPIDMEVPVLLLDGNVAIDTVDDEGPQSEGTATVHLTDITTLAMKVGGSVTDQEGEVKKFNFVGNEALLGAGSSVLEVKDGMAYLSGDLGTITYRQIKNLMRDHPKVKTIVLVNISGSVNDAVNMHTGRLIHEHGFTTKVLADSDIASGGVDFFSAGVQRVVEKGAKIGVHSWCCIGDLTAKELPRDHPAHQYQLDYFTMALGPEKGPAFYFYTLESAPFDGVHYMSDEEIKKWKIATKFID